MARKLDEFPAVPGQRYDWNGLLNGEVWQLFKGEDYTAKTMTLVATARAQAKKRSGSLKTRLVTDGEHESVVLQFRAG